MNPMEMMKAIINEIASFYPELACDAPIGGRGAFGAGWDDKVFFMRPHCDCGGYCKWCSEGAPNFLHKRSGMKVYWYKWIGREMMTENTPSDLDAVLSECLESVRRAGRR